MGQEHSTQQHRICLSWVRRLVALVMGAECKDTETGLQIFMEVGYISESTWAKTLTLAPELMRWEQV